MDLQILRDMLARWATQIVRGRRSRLGFVMATYREYVGSGSYGDDPAVEIDPDLDRLDEAFRKLPANQRGILWVHYVEPGQVKSKYDPGHGRAYHARRKFAEESLMAVYLELCERDGVESAAISAVN